MEKPKKTYFDHAMERAIKKARFLVEDLKYIRELHKDGRDEVAYGFTLAMISPWGHPHLRRHGQCGAAD